MKKGIFGMLIFILCSNCLSAQLADASNGLTVNVKIVDIYSENGRANIQLVDEKNKSVSYKAYKINPGGEVNASFTGLQPGRYAVRFFHDENENNKLDRNEMNFPTEGYGFSNNVGAYGPPKFEELLFNVKENTTIKITAIYQF